MNFTLYCLLESGKHVRYFGITMRSLDCRLRSHISEARYATANRRARWINDCIAQGKAIEIHGVQTGLSRQRALKIEKDLIRFFKTAFNLVNTMHTEPITKLPYCRQEPLSLARRKWRHWIKSGRLKPKWWFQVTDLEHGKSFTFKLYQLPWPARFVTGDGKERSASAMGRFLSTLLTQAA